LLEWRNWRTQNPASSRACGFDPHLQHINRINNLTKNRPFVGQYRATRSIIDRGEHGLECLAGHSEESRSGEFEERKKGWKRCDCPIFVSGTLAGKFKRQNTGKTDWVEARALMAQWENIQAWDGSIKDSLPTPEPQDTRITIVNATDAYIAS
jgi:hypothetical protein